METSPGGTWGVFGAGDDQGQVLVLVVIAVPEGQLLLAVGRVVHGVQVERQVARRCVEGGDELIDEHVAQALEGLDADRVLEARQGGLAGQVVILGRAVGDELEDGVGAQGGVVVLVLVPGEDAVDPGPGHLQEGVLREAGVAGVVQGVGEGPGEPDALVELADGEQPGIAGELAGGWLDDERRAEEVEDLWPGGWSTHRLSPRAGKRPGGSPG
jgi:hypothetical protein